MNHDRVGLTDEKIATEVKSDWLVSNKVSFHILTGETYAGKLLTTKCIVIRHEPST